jgi:hypothetical protein
MIGMRSLGKRVVASPILKMSGVSRRTRLKQEQTVSEELVSTQWFFAGLVVAGLASWIRGWFAWLDRVDAARDARDWFRADGRIIKAEVVRHSAESGYVFEPRIRFSYSFLGRHHIRGTSSASVRARSTAAIATMRTTRFYLSRAAPASGSSSTLETFRGRYWTRGQPRRDSVHGSRWASHSSSRRRRRCTGSAEAFLRICKVERDEAVLPRDAPSDRRSTLQTGNAKPVKELALPVSLQPGCRGMSIS